MATKEFDHFIKSVDVIYAVSLGGVISILILYTIVSGLYTMLSGLQYHILAKLAYQTPFRSMFRVPSPLRLVITMTYLAGTGVCNFVGVRSLPEAGSRAALLSSINLIPMFMSGGYEFGARLLGVSLGTYGDFHRTVGFVTVFEAAIHVVIIAKTRQISASENLHFYGILV
jgi:hypothetical protein